MIPERSALVRRLLIVLCLFPVLIWAKKPPKQIVVLVGRGFSGSGLITHLYLLLPDGSRADASCVMGMRSCELEPFHPERRVETPCYEEATEVIASCFVQEAYYADRVANNLIIYGATGGVTFHIDRAWGALKPGVPQH